MALFQLVKHQAGSGDKNQIISRLSKFEEKMSNIVQIFYWPRASAKLYTDTMLYCHYAMLWGGGGKA